MKIDLPEIDAIKGLSPSEVRLELACALYQRGRVGKVGAAELAGVDFFEFQRALGERGISSYSDESLSSDLAALNELFPK